MQVGPYAMMSLGSKEQGYVMQTGNSHTVHGNSQSKRKRQLSNIAAWIQISLKKKILLSFYQSTQILKLTKHTFTKKKIL